MNNTKVSEVREMIIERCVCSGEKVVSMEVRKYPSFMCIETIIKGRHGRVLLYKHTYDRENNELNFEGFTEINFDKCEKY